ncbi:MAG: hypothetical protein F4112_05875 [Holophagales bacterium]|nr:hypothetical protein [Holophagales bacterium]MYD23026.1 hypothetical protein [Holophagales bacterium]MYI32487.1 hypothetical protein [Holophagales bacterium]
MDLERLFSGIAVVIDDELNGDETEVNANEEPKDRIVEIVRRLKDEWDLPCYESSGVPAESLWPGLLESASLVLLDWHLWPVGASQVKAHVAPIRDRFLERAQAHFVPVFIFSNESEETVREELPEGVLGRAPVFIQSKSSVLGDESLDLSALENWVESDASVYVLKTWDRELRDARQQLFRSLYARNANWPKVFWKSYEDDEVEPSSALMELIWSSLRGRMGTADFEATVLGGSFADASGEELRRLIGEASFVADSMLAGGEARCGDLFLCEGTEEEEGREAEYLLNLRPDCDCISRNGSGEEIELYCVVGRLMEENEVRRKYHKKYGAFLETVNESIVFAVLEGRTLRFEFRDLRIEEFSELKRVGRLLHPYLTRVQQRYALFSQRQGLPRVPRAAVPEKQG